MGKHTLYILQTCPYNNIVRFMTYVLFPYDMKDLLRTQTGNIDVDACTERKRNPGGGGWGNRVTVSPGKPG